MDFLFCILEYNFWYFEMYNLDYISKIYFLFFISKYNLKYKKFMKV